MMEHNLPRNPIKGNGSVRHETEYGPMLFSILNTDNCKGNHVTRIFARRSNSAHNPMQFGEDKDFVSPELENIIRANKDMLDNMNRKYHDYENWKALTQ